MQTTSLTTRIYLFRNYVEEIFIQFLSSLLLKQVHIRLHACNVSFRDTIAYYTTSLCEKNSKFQN